MSGLRKTLADLPPAVRVLLACSTARAVSFFALLPFLPIYLHKHLQLDMQDVGLALGLCLLVATLTSVYGGYLADRYNKLRFLIFLDVVMMGLYLSLPLVTHPGLVLLLLVLVNTCSSSISVTGNAYLSDLLPAEGRARVVSLRYALQNIGAATGPFLGAWAAGLDSFGPFFLSALVTALALALLVLFRRHFSVAAVAASGAAAAPAAEREPPLDFGATLSVLRADRRLMLFTLGGILSMVVYGPLLTYLTQYLIIVENPTEAYRIVTYVSAVNATVVISLQYFVGNRLRKENLMRWLTWGTGALAIGLVGLSTSNLLIVWLIAIAVFTLGEIIIVPAEYMMIDAIAPDKLRGSYFGVQNLIFIGVALGPPLCGMLLAHSTPKAMFYVLFGVTLLGWAFYYFGVRAAEGSDEVVPAEKAA